MGISAAQSLITVVVDGVPLGAFETRAGGESTADPQKKRTAGMGPERVGVARPTTGDVTVTREYSDTDEWLRGRVGLAQASVNEQPLDIYGAPKGKATTWSGRLIGYNPGDSDSSSDDDRMLELTVRATGVS